MNIEAVQGQSCDDYLVELDKKTDYFPVVSTLTNVSELILKGALSVMDQERLDEALNSHFFKHVQDKSVIRCVTLVVPVIGNGIVYLYDLQTGALSDREVINEEGEKIPDEKAEIIIEKVMSANEENMTVILYIVTPEPILTPPPPVETPIFLNVPQPRPLFKPKLIRGIKI